MFKFILNLNSFPLKTMRWRLADSQQIFSKIEQNQFIQKNQGWACKIYIKCKICKKLKLYMINIQNCRKTLI